MISFLFAALAFALQDGSPTSDQDAGPVQLTAEQADHLLRATMRKASVPGTSLSYLSGGEVLWTQHIGLGNETRNRGLAEGSLFQLGGMTQVVTAAAALRLANGGSVDLDADVTTLLKNWTLPAHEDAPGNITLRDLLTHQAGVAPVRYKGALQRDAATLPQILAGIPQKKWNPVAVAQTPRTQMQRSAGGFCVVQQALEDSQGASFHELIDANLTVPLALEKMVFEPSDDYSPAVSKGHRRRGRQLDQRRYFYPQTAALGLWATSEPVARIVSEVWKSANGKSEFLSADLAKGFFELQGQGTTLGGFLRIGDGANAHVWTDGFTEGFSALVLLMVESGDGVVLVSNVGGATHFHQTVIDRIRGELGWPITPKLQWKAPAAPR